MPKGPGTIIRETLHSFGITDNGCGCTALANEMDQVGADRVEAQLDIYVSKMNESIKRWRRNSGLPLPQPPSLVIKELILYGIRKSRQEH